MEKRVDSRVRRARRKTAEGTAEKELQVTRPGASRWISNYSQRRFNTNRPCSTHLTCIKFPWNGRGDGNVRRLGQINKSNKWMRFEARGEKSIFFFPLSLSLSFKHSLLSFLRIIISQRAPLNGVHNPLRLLARNWVSAAIFSKKKFFRTTGNGTLRRGFRLILCMYLLKSSLRFH